MINVFIILIYFLVSWCIPWNKIDLIEGVSSSYLWDLLFSLVIIWFFKIEFIKNSKKYFPLILRSLSVILLGFLTVQIIYNFDIATPFQYIENPVYQLLVMAPIFEELVFRSAIQGKLSQNLTNKKLPILISATLFSLSHLSALWFLPANFYAFILCQVVYTFVLGWILAKSHDRGFKTIEPIFLHFLFNIFFLS